MFRLPSLRLGRVLGIPIEVNATWFVVFALVGWSLSVDYYPLEFPGRSAGVDIASGLGTAVLFFVCLVVHELSHSLVARRAGIAVKRITLFLFGGVSELVEEPRSSGVEARMALAGPAASLALGTICFASYRLLVALGVSSVAWAPLLTLTVVNTVIACFNLAPGFPMDGGRVLRSFLWWATGDRLLATRIAAALGVALAVSIALSGIWLAVDGSLSGLWLVVLGLFLIGLASSAYSSQAPRLHAAGTPVEAVMTAPVPMLSVGAQAAAVLPVLLASPLAPVAAVVEDGRLVGVVAAEGAAGALAESPTATAGDMMRPPLPGMLVDAGESLETAERRFAPGWPEALLVVRDGRLVGELSRQRLGQALAAAATRRT